jgi:hypothetical protein
MFPQVLLEIRIQSKTGKQTTRFNARELDGAHRIKRQKHLQAAKTALPIHPPTENRLTGEITGISRVKKLLPMCHLFL